jgi:preprotein translocase subunit YajC
MFTNLVLFAQTNSGNTPPPQDTFWQQIWTFAPFLLILPLFYFLMLRPMRKQEHDRKTLADNLKKNDKVLTASGILGTVVSVSETEDEVTVKVDDNTRVKMIKSSIIKNLTQEEAAKAQKEAK